MALQQTIVHHDDSECHVDPRTGLCCDCRAYHGEPCRLCGARAYHAEDCPLSFGPAAARARHAAVGRGALTPEEAATIERVELATTGNSYRLVEGDFGDMVGRVIKGQHRIGRAGRKLLDQAREDA